MEGLLSHSLSAFFGILLFFGLTAGVEAIFSLPKLIEDAGTSGAPRPSHVSQVQHGPIDVGNTKPEAVDDRGMGEAETTSLKLAKGLNTLNRREGLQTRSSTLRQLEQEKTDPNVTADHNLYILTLPQRKPVSVQNVGDLHIDADPD